MSKNLYLYPAIVKKLVSQSDLEGYVKKRDTNTTIEAENMTVKTTSASLRLESVNNIDLLASGFIHCNSKQLRNVARPSHDNDAATKAYVDSGKVLHTVQKTNVTFTRVTSVNAASASGDYCKVEFSNNDDKNFLHNAVIARKDVTFYIADGTAHTYKISDISFFESGGKRGAISIFKIPATFNASKVNDFINKSWSEFKILTVGV